MIYSSVFDFVRATKGSAGYDLRANLIDPKGVKGSLINPWGYAFNAGLGLDGKCDNDVTLTKGCTYLIPTGLFVEIPYRNEGKIRPRSSSNFKLGLVVELGTIDSDYRGEVMIQVTVNPYQNVTIRHGQAIAQIIFSKVEYLADPDEQQSATFNCPYDEFIKLTSRTKRGNGGFGSTDEKA